MEHTEEEILEELNAARKKPTLHTLSNAEWLWKRLLLADLCDLLLLLLPLPNGSIHDSHWVVYGPQAALSEVG